MSESKDFCKVLYIFARTETAILNPIPILDFGNYVIFLLCFSPRKNLKHGLYKRKFDP